MRSCLQLLGHAQPFAQLDQPGLVRRSGAGNSGPSVRSESAQDERVASVVLCTRDGVTRSRNRSSCLGLIAYTAKPRSMKRLHDGAARNLDGHRRHLSARAVAPSASKRSHSSASPVPLCRNTCCRGRASLRVDDAHLMLLRRPVDADIPVQHPLIEGSQPGAPWDPGARPALTPHWASAAACRRGTRPPQVFRTQGAKGCSRRTGPISQRRYSTADRLAREGYRGEVFGSPVVDDIS